MNLDQAYKILDYGTVPQKRGEQIKLIQSMGYTRVRGGNLLPDCHDKQLHRVAQRLFKKAEKKAHAELKEINEEEDLAHYRAFLCDSFNIPEEEREQFTISELERALMQ